MYQNKTVLVTPLNWGLGHATRMVPVIEQLLQQNAKVVIAADKRPLDFLRLKFPKIKIIRFPGYEPRYPTNSMMAFSLLLSLPNIWLQSLKAHKSLQKIVIENEIDIIISDNRFESYSRNTYNIFVTHQLQIQTKGLQSIFKTFIKKLNFNYIKKYDELWIPDLEDFADNLSGELSHITDYPIKNYHFIDPLSRLSPQKLMSNYHKIDLLIILSGPEPQRTLLEELISEQVIKSILNTMIILGKPEEDISFQKENISFISHANDEQMSAMIQSAELVISRPGYSTIMDLCVFGKKAIFIPTPGQSEQVYLAEKMKSKGYCYSEEQHIFSLERSLLASGNFSGLPKITSNNKLTLTISKLLKKEFLYS